MTHTLSRVRDDAQPDQTLHQHLARFAAGTLVAVSAALGAYAGWQFGSHGGVVLAVGLAVAAVAGEILKPYAIANTLDADSRLEPGRLLASFAVAMVCVAYSVAGHVYLAAMARTDMTAQRSAESRSINDARQDRERVLSELKAIGTPRTPAELKPLLASATKLGGNCARIESATQRESCKALPNLQAEAARYERKMAAEVVLVAADRKIAAAGTTAEKVSDPLAAALVVYLTAMGHSITVDQAGPILALIPMALLEICSMFAVVATRRRQPDRNGEVTEYHAVTSTLSAQSEPMPALPAPVAGQKDQPTASVRDAADKIVAIAKERGGTLQASSKREVARLIDASPPTASRALTALAGIAAVTTEPGNVVVSLFVQPDEIGVFVRTRDVLSRARDAVKAAGREATEITLHKDGAPGSVRIGVMHLAKGLEFRAVAVMACDNDLLPLKARIEAVADETELDDVFETERQLFYVACTRARDRLMISGVTPGSEFIGDLKR